MTYVYTVHGIPPSNNKFMGKSGSYHSYQTLKKEWAEKIQYECSPKPEKPIRKARITLTYYFRDHKERDPDNFSGKFLMDGLTKAGIIEDDNFNVVTDYRLLKGGVDKHDPHTVITIEVIEP